MQRALFNVTGARQRSCALKHFFRLSSCNSFRNHVKASRKFHSVNASSAEHPGGLANHPLLREFDDALPKQDVVHSHKASVCIRAGDQPKMTKNRRKISEEEAKAFEDRNKKAFEIAKSYQLPYFFSEGRPGRGLDIVLEVRKKGCALIDAKGKLAPLASNPGRFLFSRKNPFRDFGRLWDETEDDDSMFPTPVGKTTPFGKALISGRVKFSPNPNENNGITVLDATTGFGFDTFRFAHAGCRVIAAEQNPLLYLLVHDGLERCVEDHYYSDFRDIINRIRHIHTESGEFLSRMNADERPDIVFIDAEPSDPPSDSAFVRRKFYNKLVPPVTPISVDYLVGLSRQIAQSHVIVKSPKATKVELYDEPQYTFANRYATFHVYESCR